MKCYIAKCTWYELRIVETGGSNEGALSEP